MKKTIVKSVLGAGFALAAGVVFAADVSQTFDEQGAGAVAIDNANQKWSGDGTVVQEARVANNPTMGSAISADASTKYLAVAGSVSCTNKVASTQSAYQADFLVNIAEACDELTTDGLTGAQIAVAAGTTVDDQGRVAICVYCGSTPSWVTTDALVATGSWARVSLYFDYSASPAKCRVTVNGQPAKHNDSEYYVLIASSTHVKQLDFVGVAKIDDVFIASGAETTAVTIGDESKTVNIATLAKYGVSTNAMASTDQVGTSGMTAYEKYEAGLNLADDSKFVPTDMALTKDGETLKATITIPVADDNGQAYSVVVTDGSSTRTITEGIATVSVTGGKALTFPIPTDMGAVLKFTVKASL